MKKLAKILVLVLSVALLVGALVMITSAADEPDIWTWTEEKVIKVYYTGSAAKYEADKADGVLDQFDAEYNVLVDALNDAANHCATGKPAYVVLADDFNEGKSVVDSTGAVYKGTLSLGGSVVTLDLNGHDLNMTVGRILRSSGNGDVSSQRLQVNGASDVKIIGNGGTLRTCANLFQFNSGGGNLTFDGGDGGLNIVASKMYSYNYDKDTYELFSGTGNRFNGSEGIVKGFAGNYKQTRASYVNLLGDVTFTRENDLCVSFVCMYHTVGGFNINIGKADADAAKRDTATFTVVEPLASASAAPANFRVFMHRDDQKQENSKDVLLSYALKAAININNATVKVPDSRFVDVYNKNFANTTADDVITYNAKNSTLDFAGAKGTTYPGFLLAGNGKVPYRITIDGCEIYDDTTLFNSGDTAGNALTKIKNSYVSVTTSTGSLTTFSMKAGTIIAENSYFNVGAFCNFGVYWKDYDPSDTTTAWPAYAATEGGFGVIIKDGNYFTTTKDKGNNGTAKASPGKYTGTGFNSNRLGTLGNGKWYQVFSNKYGNLIWNMVSDTAVPAVSTAANSFLSFTGTAGTEAKDYTAASVKSFAGHSLVLGTGTDTASRTGKYTLADNPVTDDKNTYVVHTYYQDPAKSYSASQPYFYYGTNSISATSAATYRINDYAYYTIDHDLMTTEEFFTQDFNVQFFFRSYTDAKTIQGGAYILLDADGTWNSPNSDDSYKMDYTPGVWQHITYVLEMPLKADGSVDYIKMFDDAKIHLYIDGVFAKTFTKVMASTNSFFADAANYKDGGKHAGISEIRIAYCGGDQKGRGDAELAIDNVLYAKYPTGTDFTRDQLGSYMLNKYEEFGIAQPDDVPFAVAKDSKGNPVMMDKATFGDYIIYSIAGMNEYQDVTLYADYKGELDLDELVVKADLGVSSVSELLEMLELDSFNVPYKANGKAVKYAENDILVEEYNAENDIYTLRNAVAEDYVKIYFDDLDPATTNAYIEVLKGKTVSADKFPVYEEQERVAEYAKIYFGGWAEKLGDATASEVKVGDTDVTLVPGVSKTVSTLDDILFNISVNDNTALNYYLPTEWYDDAAGEDDLIPGFKILTIQNQREGEKITSASLLAPTGGNAENGFFKYTYGGKDYYVFTSYPTISNVDKSLAFVITYEFVYEGITFTASARYETSVTDYCDKIVCGAYTAAEKEIAANYLRYAYEYMSALVVIYPTNEAYAASLARLEAAFNDQIKAYCTEYEADVLTDKGDKDLEDLAEYIEDGGFAINGTRFNLQLSFVAGKKVKGVQITTYGIAGDREKVVGNNTFEAGYKVIVIGSHSTQQGKDGDGYFTYYNTANFLAYNMFETITITLTIDDGSEDGLQVSGTYSLAAYYNDLVAAGTDAAVLEAYAKVFCATKELGDSAVAYRFEEVK